MDVNPYYGKPFDNRPFETAGKNGVLLLMSDSTNVERDGHSISEETLFQKFEDIFIKSTGLTVVSVFASNIARIGQIFELAHKLGKKIALMGRSMEQNVAHAFELGYLKHYHDVIIPIGDLASYNRKDVILISTGSQGEYRSGLSRLSQNENKGLRLVEGDLVVLSSKFIPGNEKAIGKMINNLFRLGIDVLYEAISDIHVSGHANAEELLAMITMTKPKFFMPVHGEYRHLVKHRKLALTANIEKNNAVIAVNGDVWELTQDSLKKIDEIEENRVLIEGEGGNDVSQVVIKDRRKVAESGIVFSILIRNAITNQIIAGPDLIAKGFLEGENQTEIFESAKKVVHTIISESEKISSQKQVNLQEEIRIGLRRFFNSRVGKKPVVLPIIIDV